MTGVLTRLSTGRVVKGSQKSKYVIVGIGSKTYLAHRIIWKMKTGEDPVEIIDHHDCDSVNNRWVNLRQAEQKENLN